MFSTPGSWHESFWRLTHPTTCASVASWRAMTAEAWNRRPSLMLSVTSRTNRWKLSKCVCVSLRSDWGRLNYLQEFSDDEIGCLLKAPRLPTTRWIRSGPGWVGQGYRKERSSTRVLDWRKKNWRKKNWRQDKIEKPHVYWWGFRAPGYTCCVAGDGEVIFLRGAFPATDFWAMSFLRAIGVGEKQFWYFVG